MPPYVRKPEQIDAMQWDGSALVLAWLDANRIGYTRGGDDDLFVAAEGAIQTVFRGDWIVVATPGTAHVRANTEFTDRYIAVAVDPLREI